MNGDRIGTVVKTQYANGGTGDYYIIALDDSEISHKIGSSTNGYMVIDGGTYHSPIVGTYITKYGYKTGYSYGTVTATNVTINAGSSKTIYGMTQVSISFGTGSIGGDSGGPYLAGGMFCGIHHGHVDNVPTTVFFTPYSVIYNGGFTAIGLHNCTSWTDIGPTNHSGYCIICQETVYEAHYEHWNSSTGRCIRCGRTDLINVPGTN